MCFVHVDKKEFFGRGRGNLCVFGNKGNSGKIFDTRDFLKKEGFQICRKERQQGEMLDGNVKLFEKSSLMCVTPDNAVALGGDNSHRIASMGLSCPFLSLGYTLVASTYQRGLNRI